MKLKKRIIALNVGIIAVMLFSFFYIWAVGGNFTLHTNSYFQKNNLPKVSVDIKDKTVVKCDGTRFEKGDMGYELVVDFSAVGQGDTNVAVYYRMGDNFEPNEYSFNVNAFGTLFDRSWGRINFNGSYAVIYAILIQLVLTEAVMVWMFIDYRRKGDFSYAMIACGGISIYICFLAAFVFYSAINSIVFDFSLFLTLVALAGRIMLFLISPVMLLLSVSLALSNVWLMRHEGCRTVNALGIIFAVLWFIGTVVTIGDFFFPELVVIPFDEAISVPIVYIVGYMECMFLSTIVCSFLAAKYKTPYDRDYIIILGCAIRKDGTLTPLLRGRVDAAVEFEKKQYEKTGRHAVFVPSGGQGSDEVMSEGEAMENYLLSVGVPAQQIAREDKSVNTFENMKLSKAVIEKHTDDLNNKKIAFSTTNYHVFRGYILAKKNGFKAMGISAKTKLYFFPNAFLREFVGLLFDKKWKHIVFILLIVCFFLSIKLITG